MEKKDQKQFLLFLENMENHGKLKNDSLKKQNEFWGLFGEIIATARKEKNENLTSLLLKLESKNVEFFTSLKKDYFTYGIIGQMAHEELGEINEF